MKRMGKSLTLDRGLLLLGFRREEAEELSKFAAVLSILVDTKLHVLAE